MARSNPSRNNKSTPLAFFGTADFSVGSLKALLDSGYRVEVVITKPDSGSGRRQHLQEPAVKTLAESHDIAVLQPANRQDLARQLAPYDFDWGVVVAYGMIIPSAVLRRFAGGLVNTHASLLPKWRGPSPIETAILHGDQETGNSIMRITASMDAGPVYTQSRVPLTDKPDRIQLSQLLGQDGAELLIACLDSIMSGELQPRDQDESAASYCPLLRKQDGHIDWKQPATLLERQIRAYLGWPGSSTELSGKSVIVEAAHVAHGGGEPGQVLRTPKGELLVYTGEDALIIDRLRPAGKNSMSGAEFLRGYGI